MRLLHTADWHLGARLLSLSRLGEHEVFLDWLVECLGSEKVDGLLVSGDVFDSTLPPQDCVGLYYDFIRRLADLKKVQTVITGGNHDSASHLNAPRDLLEKFKVHVFGSARESCWVDFGEALIGAVPFLRERDLRVLEPGETSGQVHEQVQRAITAFYAKQLQIGSDLAMGRPLIAMGHLTVMGGQVSDSERDIHIGNLAAIPVSVFKGFDYTALGHLHRPQCVGRDEKVRYSGSPLALSFSEAGDSKSAVIYDTQSAEITLLPVPNRQKLLRVRTDRANLAENLAAVPSGAWAEVTVNLSCPEADLDRQVREAAGGRFEVLKVLTEFPEGAFEAVWQTSAHELTELRPKEVFQELLRQKQVEDAEILGVFDELLALHESRETA